MISWFSILEISRWAFLVFLMLLPSVTLNILILNFLFAFIASVVWHSIVLSSRLLQLCIKTKSKRYLEGKIIYFIFLDCNYFFFLPQIMCDEDTSLHSAHLVFWLIFSFTFLFKDFASKVNITGSLANILTRIFFHND